MASCALTPESHISVRISTSSSKLDLSQKEPFTITVSMTLTATHPITFKRPFTPVFNGLVYSNGLTFRNTRTGKYVPRPTRHSQYNLSLNSKFPTAENRNIWTTLFPGHHHNLEETFRPTLAPPPIAPTPGMTAAEMKQLQSRQTPVTTWNHVRGFENGETYEIGISHGAAVHEWVKGGLDEILGATKAGTTQEFSTRKIYFVVTQSAEFTVARPDDDGVLNGMNP